VFIQNKYTKCYNRIIERAQLYHRTKKKDTYFESHHILPKSLGGIDSSDNKILLTAKEHFICHLLLTIDQDGSKGLNPTHIDLT
jgi:hypothetical protein